MHIENGFIAPPVVMYLIKHYHYHPQIIGITVNTNGSSNQDILKNVPSSIPEAKGGLGGRAYKAPVLTANTDHGYGSTAGNHGVRAVPGGVSDYSPSSIYTPSPLGVNSSNNGGNIDPTTDGLGSRYVIFFINIFTY
jgi:hypothetical protein